MAETDEEEALLSTAFDNSINFNTPSQIASAEQVSQVLDDTELTSQHALAEDMKLGEA